MLQDVWPFQAVSPGYAHKQACVLRSPPHIVINTAAFI